MKRTWLLVLPVILGTWASAQASYPPQGTQAPSTWATAAIQPAGAVSSAQAQAVPAPLAAPVSVAPPVVAAPAPAPAVAVPTGPVVHQTNCGPAFGGACQNGACQNGACGRGCGSHRPIWEKIKAWACFRAHCTTSCSSGCGPYVPQPPLYTYFACPGCCKEGPAPVHTPGCKTCSTCGGGFLHRLGQRADGDCGCGGGFLHRLRRNGCSDGGCVNTVVQPGQAVVPAPVAGQAPVATPPVYQPVAAPAAYQPVAAPVTYPPITPPPPYPPVAGRAS